MSSPSGLPIDVAEGGATYLYARDQAKGQTKSCDSIGVDQGFSYCQCCLPLCMFIGCSQYAVHVSLVSLSVRPGSWHLNLLALFFSRVMLCWSHFKGPIIQLTPFICFCWILKNMNLCFLLPWLLGSLHLKRRNYCVKQSIPLKKVWLLPYLLLINAMLSINVNVLWLLCFLAHCSYCASCYRMDFLLYNCLISSQPHSVFCSLLIISSPHRSAVYAI